MDLDSLEYLFKSMASEIKELDNVQFCTVHISNFNGSKKPYLRLKIQNGNIYGISYVHRTKIFTIWSNFGDFKDIKDQIHLVFNNPQELIHWLSTNDLDEVVRSLKEASIGSKQGY